MSVKIECCGECEKKLSGSYVTEEVKSSPWSERETVGFCDESCKTEFFESPYHFAHQFCEKCEEWIPKHNPQNGWRGFFVSFEGDTVCVGCYQNHLLENGQPEDDFIRSSSIKGGDFFSTSELREAGYEEVEGLTRFRIRSKNDAREFNARAAQMVTYSSKVITSYDSLGLGGIEGYVTLWAKTEDMSRPQSRESSTRNKARKALRVSSIATKKSVRSSFERKTIERKTIMLNAK